MEAPAKRLCGLLRHSHHGSRESASVHVARRLSGLHGQMLVGKRECGAGSPKCHLGREARGRFLLGHNPRGWRHILKGAHGGSEISKLTVRENAVGAGLLGSVGVCGWRVVGVVVAVWRRVKEEEKEV